MISPADRLASVVTSSDLNLATNGPVQILLETKNFPPSGVVKVRLTPKYGNYSQFNATWVSGDFAESLWAATNTFPNGFAVIQAHATSP